jgi:TMEM175 potassium channel family protein
VALPPPSDRLRTYARTAATTNAVQAIDRLVGAIVRRKVPSVATRAGWLGVGRWLGLTGGDASSPEQRETGRLVAFSDAVVAITITLLILEIKPPADYQHLLHGLAALWPSYLAYAVTFLFIGQVWANHHVLFHHIRAADRAVLLLNTLLLMAVAFLPFATSVLAGSLRSGHGERVAVVFYGLAFDLTALTFNAVWQYARHHHLVSETLSPGGAIAIGRRFRLALAWLTVAILLGLAFPILGVALIAAFNAFYWLPIRSEGSIRQSS